MNHQLIYPNTKNGPVTLNKVGDGNGGGGTVTNVSALTLGTAGTDLSSTVANPTTTPVITLNVPTASASNRGVVSSTDWITFNSKQNTLVSATNIKTINSNSILGGGDLIIIPPVFVTAIVNTTVPASTTRYATIYSNGLASTEIGTVIAPVAFTAKNLYVYLRTAQTATGNIVITLRKNGADTALTVTIAAGALGGTTHTDLVNSVAFVAGDLISFSLVNNGTATSGAIPSISFQII